MNTQIIIEYLSELSANNNREWYHANKEDYKKANAEFEGLLQALIWEIGKFDSSILHNRPKDLTFKLVRDTRFSLVFPSPDYPVSQKQSLSFLSG